MADSIKYLVTIICVILNLYSCHYDYQLCEPDITNEHLKLYNDILNELVEHRFYNRYLGKDEERIFLEYASEDRDTAKIKKEIIKLQNKLYQDTARFCIIYLDTSFRPYFNPWEYFQNDTGKFASETRKLILSFSSNGQEVIDSINTIQDRYSSADFQLCTAKVLSLREVSNQKDGKCGIGKVSLSKVFLEKSKDRGILYCNFYCGGLCGYGSILIIEKQNGRWKIIEQRITRIS